MASLAYAVAAVFQGFSMHCAKPMLQEKAAYAFSCACLCPGCIFTCAFVCWCLVVPQAQEHVEANVPLAAAPRLAEKMWQLVLQEVADTLKQQQQKTVAV
jgi:hypothetical protein